MSIKSRVFRVLTQFCAQDLVETLYRGLLARAPEPGELAARGAQLQLTGALADLVTELVRSEEFRKAQLATVAPEWVHSGGAQQAAHGSG